MSEKQGNGLKIVPHVVTGDSLMDVPFRIAGHQLRWISAYVQSANSHRIWKNLKKSDLDTKTWDALKDKYYGLFNHDGDTIRYGENVLSYAPLELLDKVNAEKRSEAKSQLGQVMRPKNKNVKVDQRETRVERGADIGKDFFDK